MSAHPAISELALHARGDLPLWRRWRVRRHLRACDDCADRLAGFEQSADLLLAAPTLPLGMNEGAWESLALEMTANIRLGIAAGACVGATPVRSSRPRLTWAFAGLAAVVAIASVESSRVRNDDGVSAGSHDAVVRDPVVRDPSLRTLEASSSGLGVHSSGQLLFVSAPPGMDVIQTVNTRGDMRARYADESGVTINAVYADAE